MSLARNVPNSTVQALRYYSWERDGFKGGEIWNAPLGDMWFCVKSFLYDEAADFYKGRVDRNGRLNACPVDNCFELSRRFCGRSIISCLAINNLRI